MRNSTVQPSLDSSLIPGWPTAPQISSDPTCSYTTRRCSSSRLNGGPRSRCTRTIPISLMKTILWLPLPSISMMLRSKRGASGWFREVLKTGRMIIFIRAVPICPRNNILLSRPPPVPPKQGMCCSSATSPSTGQDPIQATNPVRRCWSRCAIPRTSQWVSSICRVDRAWCCVV